jgi:hypothetical protein
MMAIATNPTMPLLPQRCEEPEQVADDVAAQERHGGAEQHLQHDGQRHQQ